MFCENNQSLWVFGRCLHITACCRDDTTPHNFCTVTPSVQRESDVLMASYRLVITCVTNFLDGHPNHHAGLMHSSVRQTDGLWPKLSWLCHLHNSTFPALFDSVFAWFIGRVKCWYALREHAHTQKGVVFSHADLVGGPNFFGHQLASPNKCMAAGTNTLRTTNVSNKTAQACNHTDLVTLSWAYITIQANLLPGSNRGCLT
jgi:hypothetical protein